MKTRVFLSVLFCVLAAPAFAALTDADLDKIRLIVKDEVQKEIALSETRMKDYIDTKIETVNVKIDAVEERLGTRINALGTKIDGVEERLGTRINALDTKIDGVEERLGTRIDSVEKQMTFLLNIIYGLIALIIIAIGIPQLILTWRSRRDNTLENRVEILTQEIEALKQRHIAKP